MADGLVRVDPPDRLNINVTMRPPTTGGGNRPNNKSIGYKKWRLSRNNPLMDAFSSNSEIAHREHNDSQLNDLVEGGHLDRIANNNNGGSSVSGTTSRPVNSPDTIERLISDADRA